VEWPFVSTFEFSLFRARDAAGFGTLSMKLRVIGRDVLGAACPSWILINASEGKSALRMATCTSRLEAQTRLRFCVVQRSRGLYCVTRAGPRQ
jgi:hypothetical protein